MQLLNCFPLSILQVSKKINVLIYGARIYGEKIDPSKVKDGNRDHSSSFCLHHEYHHHHHHLGRKFGFFETGQTSRKSKSVGKDLAEKNGSSSSLDFLPLSTIQEV